MQETESRREFQYLPKALLLAAVAVSYWCVQYAGGMNLVSRMIALPATLSSNLVRLLEHHLWQFALAMIAMAVLSRGHLWSYGINSMNLRTSFRYLAYFLAAALVAAIVAVAVPLFSGQQLPFYFATMTGPNTVLWLFFLWVATPVADEVLFHGLFQTVAAKYWPVDFVVGAVKIPVAVVLSTVLFAVGRVNVPIYGSQYVEYTLAVLVGFFGGWVYYKTRSLLAPMLAQAFFYGMPFVLRLVYAWAG